MSDIETNSDTEGLAFRKGERLVSVNRIKPYGQNPRIHSEKQIELLANHIRDVGFDTPIVVDEDMVIIKGHGRLEALKLLGESQALIKQIKGLTPAQKKAARIADNKLAELAKDHTEFLKLELSDLHGLDVDIRGLGFDDLAIKELDILINDETPKELNFNDYGEGETGALERTWGVPPYSVINTINKRWAEGLAKWDNYNLKKPDGRDEDLIDPRFGTSCFDPYLTEILIKWFSPSGGQVLDPFAGGPVRGIVTTALGRGYTGIELSTQQTAANKNKAVSLNLKPVWINGDSIKIESYLPNTYKADMILSCPPYHDLEVYSEQDGDISNMTYDEFLAAYKQIIAKACCYLVDNSFVAWVVAEIRDKKTGYYKNFVADTVAAFADAGLHFYNEIILLNAVGTLPLRAGKYFKTTRKVGKHHQNVLIFLKGNDPRQAVNRLSDNEQSGPL